MRPGYLLGLALCGCVLAEGAHAQGARRPNVKTEPHPTDSSKWVVTVTVNSGDFFGDVHFTSLSGMEFPPLEGGTNPDVVVTRQAEGPAPDGEKSKTWKASRSKNGQQLHVYADGPNNTFPPEQGGESPPKETYKFTIDFNDAGAQGAQLRTVAWNVTDDGDTDPTDGSFGTDGDVPANEAKLPQKKKTQANTGPQLGTIGTTAPLEIETDAGNAGLRFTVYGSTRLNEEYTDPLGIGIETVSYPIPPAWGVAIANPTGVVTAQGAGDPIPQVTIPNDPALVGETFYLVIALRPEGDETIWFVSDPIEVTIRGP